MPYWWTSLLNNGYFLLAFPISCISPSPFSLSPHKKHTFVTLQKWVSYFLALLKPIWLRLFVHVFFIDCIFLSLNTDSFWNAVISWSYICLMRLLMHSCQIAQRNDFLHNLSNLSFQADEGFKKRTRPFLMRLFSPFFWRLVDINHLLRRY